MFAWSKDCVSDVCRFACGPSSKLTERRFSQHGRHVKIGVTNFDGILHHRHSARVRK